MWRKLPLTYAWLDKALMEHAWFLQKNYSGDWNHGTDESLALFGIGCTLQRNDLKRIASDRLTSAIKTSIDTQGSTNEQSTAYAQFNYLLWGRAIDVLRKCGVDPGTTITARRRELAKWLALATNSLGNLPQLGDSEVVRTVPVAGHGPRVRRYARRQRDPADPADRDLRRRVHLRTDRMGRDAAVHAGVDVQHQVRAGAETARTQRPHVDHVHLARAGHPDRRRARRVQGGTTGGAGRRASSRTTRWP